MERTRLSSWWRHASAVAVFTLVLTGCDDVSLSFGGLDTGPLEAEIEADIEGRTGIDIESVSCPDDVQPQAGRVFVCRAHAVDGSVGTVEVEQVDDAGAVEWELTDVAAPTATD